MPRPFQVHPLIDALVAKRQHLNLTQQQVADQLGVTRSAIARFETNTQHSPQLATLERYATAVGMQLLATDSPPLTEEVT